MGMIPLHDRLNHLALASIAASEDILYIPGPTLQSTEKGYYENRGRGLWVTEPRREKSLYG